MDRATKLRSLGEVKRRGGWNQHRSAAPYDKGSRLGFSAQEHATMLTVHDDECQKHLEGMLIYVRTVVKGRPGRALQIAGFPVRFWDSQFGRKGDIANLAVLRQVRKRHSNEQSCVCSRCQLRLSALRSAVQPWFEVLHSRGEPPPWTRTWQ